MNWLAHLRLAPEHELVRIGNLAGDFVRGVDVDALHADVRRGIEQHRAIDRFTDAHEVHRRSRARFSERHRRFAGVALDVFYDHFLARDWHQFGDGRPLADFVAEVHGALAQHEALLPPELARLHHRMASHGWLLMYDAVDGIEKVLRAMARRGRRASPLGTITDELRQNYAALEADFAELWPELRAFAAALQAR